jgi:hypothetical protein
VNRIITPNDAFPDVMPVRDMILKIQDDMDKMPGVMHGDCFPLKHQFGHNVYVREINMPKGTLIVSKIHKFESPYFVMTGKCSVLTEDGIMKIQAPFYGMTKAGTKRILYVHEDSTWVTVHATKEKDLDKIEEEIIAKDFDDLGIIDVDAESVVIGNFIQAILEEQKNEKS